MDKSFFDEIKAETAAAVQLNKLNKEDPLGFKVKEGVSLTEVKIREAARNGDAFCIVTLEPQIATRVSKELSKVGFSVSIRNPTNMSYYDMDYYSELRIKW